MNHPPKAFDEGLLRDVLEIAEEDFLVGGGEGMETPEVHAERQRNLGNSRGVVGGRIVESSQNILGGSDWLKAAHQSACHVGGGPNETCGGESRAV